METNMMETPIDWCIGEADKFWAKPSTYAQQLKDLDSKILTICKVMENKYPNQTPTGISHKAIASDYFNIAKHTKRAMTKILSGIRELKGTNIPPLAGIRQPKATRATVITDSETGEITSKKEDQYIPYNRFRRQFSDRNTADEELKDNTELLSDIINLPNTPYEQLSASQLINVSTFTTKYGKVHSRVLGNMRTADRIGRLKPHNFGSVGNFDIDTLPDSYGKVKGTEIYYITAKHNSFRGKQAISRRMLTDILQKWCYIAGIRYIHSSNDSTITGVKLWATEVNEQITGKTEYLLTGNQATQMIKDLIFLTRNQSKSLVDKLENKKVSQQLHDTIIYRTLSEKIPKEQVIQDMKERLYYDQQIGDKMWSFPKFPIVYLEGVLKELQFGNYLSDIIVPLIKDTKKYPIRCTETHVFPMTKDRHSKNADDYDISKYLWERD